MPLCVHGQSDLAIGAAANGTGYIRSADDAFSIFNNPAALSDLRAMRIGFSYDLLPSFRPYDRVAAAVTIPMTKGVASAGLFRFGDELYSEQCIAAGYAHKIGITSLGIRANLMQISAEGFGSKQFATISLSGLTELTPWLTIGAQIINVNQPKVRDDERIPTTVSINAKAKAGENISVLAEAEKNVYYDVLLKTGLEYQYNRKISVRTGFHVEPVAGFFGFGLHLTKMHFDYAFSYLPIGTRHQFSWVFMKGKAK